MPDALEFILYLEEQELSDLYYQQYLQTDMSMSFEDFKVVQKYHGLREETAAPEEVVTQEEEEARLEFASQFIKPK